MSNIDQNRHGLPRRKWLWLFCITCLWCWRSVALAERSTCSLRLAGSDGIVQARITCDGPVVSFSSQHDLVVMQEQTGVVREAAGCGGAPTQCLLTICSSNTVVLSQLSIRDVAMPSFPGVILCFSGSSNVILEYAAVSNTLAGQFGAVQFNQQVSATLKECTFSNNTAVSEDVAKGTTAPWMSS